MRTASALALALLTVVAVAACGGAAPSTATAGGVTATSSGATAAGAGAAVEKVSLADVGLDAARLDRKADPCDDFYRFACGNWLDTKEIPADLPTYGTFQEIFDNNEATLHDILDQAAHSPGDDPVTQKIGTYYAACMDEDEIEKHGSAPLDPIFAAIKKVQSVKSLLGAVAELHRSGVDVFFAVGAVQDKKDATQMIAQIGQGGLGLPDRDYYLDEGQEAKGLREAYRAHLERMFALVGRKPAAAKQAAADTLAIELAIAKSHKTRVQLRDEVGTYNRIDRAGLVKASPRLAWDLYWKTLGIADVQKINTVSVAYVERFDTIATAFTPAQWQSYLTVHALEDKAGLLAHRFVDESFAFQKLLLGQKELRVRWKRCVSLTDRDLGELLGQPYLVRAFTGDSKTRALEIIRGIADVFGQNLDKLAWMDDATKAKAHDKLAKIALNIGYPSKWRSYDFALDRKSFARNALRAAQAETARQLAKIGKPVDREEWTITPPTVNAYYDAPLNEEVFPAGILQPPFFSVKASVPVNFGGIGMFMGHELTHGYDDQGAQYDGDGNLSGWWPEQVVTAFTERTQCVAKSYSQYEPLPGVHLNGELTNGENIADMGGVKMAFAAYRKARKDAKTVQVADGFNEDQQFFLAYAQAWCEKMTDEFEKLVLTADPHSPGRYRIIGSLSSLPAFAEVWKCPVGSKMHPKDVCEVW